MAVIPVIVARDDGQLAQLTAIQLAIGNGHAQHVGMQLQVDSILQAKRLELVFQQFAR